MDIWYLIFESNLFITELEIWLGQNRNHLISMDRILLFIQKDENVFDQHVENGEYTMQQLLRQSLQAFYSATGCTVYWPSFTAVFGRRRAVASPGGLLA